MNPEKLAGFYKKNAIGKIGLLKWEDQKDHELPMDFADMLGWKELTEKTKTFSVEQLSSGIYIIHIKTEKGINSLRFVRE